MAAKPQRATSKGGRGKKKKTTAEIDNANPNEEMNEDSNL